MPSGSGSRSVMDDYEGISVVDVYDIVTDFAKELRPIMEIYGAEPLNNIMSKVITILEHLEAQAVKIGKLNTLLLEKETVISNLEKDKAEKAADRDRFDKELEQIEEHWREESHEMVLMINRLQEENRKLLKAIDARQDSSPVAQSSQPLSPEVDVVALQKSRATIEKLRDQLKMKDRELANKNSEVESLADQVDRLTSLNKDLRKKQRMREGQIRSLIDERADFLAHIQSQQYELNHLKQLLGIAEKEHEDIAQNSKLSEGKSMPDVVSDDPKKPKFTSDELKGILQERNALKARVSELEEELSRYKANEEKVGPEENEADESSDEDAPVEGPLPYEPSDAPWKKSDSGIRKLFKKLFNEANVTLLGNSPKKNLSFAKMSLSSNVSDSSI